MLDFLRNDFDQLPPGDQAAQYLAIANARNYLRSKEGEGSGSGLHNALFKALGDKRLKGSPDEAVYRYYSATAPGFNVDIHAAADVKAQIDAAYQARHIVSPQIKAQYQAMTALQESWRIITPAGGIKARFPDDEALPMQLDGAPSALDWFGHYINDSFFTGAGGGLITLDSMTPYDLYCFCQPEGGGVMVLPPFEALLDIQRQLRSEDAIADDEEAAAMDDNGSPASQVVSDGVLTDLEWVVLDGIESETMSDRHSLSVVNVLTIPDAQRIAIDDASGSITAPCSPRLWR